MRRFLCAAVAVAAPFLGACGGEGKPSDSMPRTNMTRWDQSEEYRAQRAAERDRAICLNPLRRCRDMSPEDWRVARIEWELSNP